MHITLPNLYSPIMEKAALKWKSQIRSRFPAVRAAAADGCCAENTGRCPGALPALRARCLPCRWPRRHPGGGRDPPFSPAWVGEPNPRAWLSAGSLIALERGDGRRFPRKLSEPTAEEVGLLGWLLSVTAEPPGIGWDKPSATLPTPRPLPSS